MSKMQSIASRLNRRITYNTVTIAQDNYGGIYETESKLFSCFAEIKTRTGDEVFQSCRDVSQVEYIITIRYRTDISSDGYIYLEDGKRLNVLYVRDPNGRREILEIGALWKNS